MFSLLSTLLVSSLVSVYNPRIPVVLDRDHNIVSEIVIPSESARQASGEVEVSIEGIPRAAVKDVRLVSTGTVPCLYTRSGSIVMWAQFRQWGSGHSAWCDPRYVTDLDSSRPDKDGKVTLSFDRPLVKGDNLFYVSVSIASSKVDLTDTFSVKVSSMKLDGESVDISETGQSAGRRYAIALRNHGDDGIDTFRIPALATAKNGDLVAAYDIRWDSSMDLQSDIDVGVQRSSDGGKTWSKMQVAMDMGEYGGLPRAQNGTGDPCILVDEKSGDIFIFALWAHGLKGQTATTTSTKGFDPIDVPQLVMVRSRDCGRSWEAPVNITEQVKDPECAQIFQGPGRGITMSDGTLVVPVQVWSSHDNASDTIIYSKDGGDTWQVSSLAVDHVCEDQVAEIEPGVLLLNMRNYGNAEKTRKVYVTEDLGKTWKVHESNNTLVEPQCQASLLAVKPQGLLLFANPSTTTTKDRVNFTIRASKDGGVTWPYSLLIDEEKGWGYSCMTMIDDDTLGIVYEGSTAQILFQAIKLSDILAGR
jgi:sialidase-1